MEFKEINVPEGIMQEFDHEGSLIDITVDVMNVDNIHSNAKLDVSYADTLEDIETTMGSVPAFMKFLPKKTLIHDWSSWKMVDEIDMERARYLLNTDEMSEEKVGQIHA